jgi:transposase
LSIEDRIPDHSAFTRARNERFRDSDILRRVFERVVAACIAAGLVGAEGFAAVCFHHSAVAATGISTAVQQHPHRKRG